MLIVLALTLIGVGTAVYDAFAPTTEEPLDAHSHAAVLHACDDTYHTLKARPPLTHATTRARVRAHASSRRTRASTPWWRSSTSSAHPTRTAAPRCATGRADWRALLTRRAQYAQQLARTNKRIDFVVPISPVGAPITDRMNQYSRTHDLNQCLTENLQAETLDTIRQYPRDNTVSDN